MKGRFIVFEGGEGSGKTTQVRRLAKNLKKHGCKVLITCQPGGTKLGQKIRSILLHSSEKLHGRTEVLLFCADRAHHIERQIKPALEKGKIVICDRFSASTFAYQYYGRQSEDIKKIKGIDRYARAGIKPDLVILLSISPEIGLNRVSKDVKNGNRTQFTKFEQQKLKFHQRLQDGYFEIAENSGWRWNIVDARLSKKEIEEKIWQTVKEIL